MQISPGDVRTVHDNHRRSGSLRIGNELQRPDRIARAFDDSANAHRSSHVEGRNDTFRENRGARRELKTEDVPNEKDVPNENPIGRTTRSFSDLQTSPII